MKRTYKETIDLIICKYLSGKISWKRCTSKIKRTTDRQVIKEILTSKIKRLFRRDI